MPFALPIGNTFLGVDQGDKGEHDNDANNLENTSDDLPGLGLIELFLFLFFFFHAVILSNKCLEMWIEGVRSCRYPSNRMVYELFLRQ